MGRLKHVRGEGYRWVGLLADASQRMQILRAFDRCFSGGSAKRPQAQTLRHRPDRREAASDARQIFKEGAATYRTPAKPKSDPKLSAVEPYMLSERAYLLEFGH